jgi:two-component system cell cycle response regulator DivK
MKHRILVVEDNALNRELLCDWLDAEGYEVISAENLKTALAAVESHPPHVVLLDIQLGADDGLSLASWMREQQGLRSIPVIAVTAHAMAVEQERILLAGCNACISKPVDFRQLSEHLKRWLSASASSQRKLAPNAERGTGSAELAESKRDERAN